MLSCIQMQIQALESLQTSKCNTIPRNRSTALLGPELNERKSKGVINKDSLMSTVLNSSRHQTSILCWDPN